jgi:preprotein translocase subunit SecE
VVIGIIQFRRRKRVHQYVQNEKNTVRIVTHIHFINKRYKFESKIDFPCGGLARMANVGGFFKNVMSEMRKVSWPKRKELTRYTIVVLATVVLMAVFFAIVDLGISELFRWYLEL